MVKVHALSRLPRRVLSFISSLVMILAIVPAVALLTAAPAGAATDGGFEIDGNAVVNTAGVKPGQTVAVIGLGGVGLASVLGAVASGASQIIAVDLRSDKLELARELGATAVVNGGAEDVVDKVRALTNGGVDFAFEESQGDQGRGVLLGLILPVAAGLLQSFEVEYSVVDRLVDQLGPLFQVTFSHAQVRVSVA